MLPEKLHRGKILVELEPAEHQASDLSGDAGKPLFTLLPLLHVGCSLQLMSAALLNGCLSLSMQLTGICLAAVP